MTADKQVEVKTDGNVALGTTEPKTELHLKTDEEKAQDFIKEYDELVQKHQMQIVANPAFKVSQDTGTFSVVIQVSVGRLPKKE